MESVRMCQSDGKGGIPGFDNARHIDEGGRTMPAIKGKCAQRELRAPIRVACHRLPILRCPSPIPPCLR